ncbi:beta-galactosidase/beta-glucuronidase [Saonia flava]|uniref:Beta-galactosidase/beta-glucuronidase n=1 Tax=Saonia flava TaxID=523696 RepID=A0A846QV13_9FLAO|nr:sugar-binding domain-containing protein [Saonia flava]NJB71858.1 beta-galactosidase/beta-glucuronidase [Saonia flava]
MNKKILFLTLFLSISCLSYSQNKEEHIQSRWAQHVTPENTLKEYPRPQMVRKEWKNLNGLWDYIILPEGNTPNNFEDQILVPYPIESKLSGVQKNVSDQNVLWYQRNFEIPAKWSGQQIMLHFGAVDWEATVYVNGQKMGMHQGGYDPFSFDVTKALHESGKQVITVAVWDPTSTGSQPIGKQKTNPEGIFYTPVSGIWQTVWLEPVPSKSISSLKMTPDIDNSSLSVVIKNSVFHPKENCLTIKVFDGNKEVVMKKASFGERVKLNIKDQKLWSPNNPHLYDIEVSFEENSKTVDRIKSYFGMRKIALGKDKNGNQRLMLNNEFLFHFGTLDQGWWPDGLYTAPTDEALKFDIETTKKLGFNTIRKHVKVEPARWYYHCDQIGMLVWQDMPNGDGLGTWKGPSGYDWTEDKRKPQSAHQYRKEWKNIMDANYNNPSIVIWVPFNEAWGQFDTENIINWTMDYDTSRLVNGPSGGNYFPVGHMIDTHVYPGPGMPNRNLHAPIMFKDRSMVLGEFGGLGLVMKSHLWQKDKNWGYRNIENQEKLFEAYSNLINQIPALIKNGLSAAIYTQTTDVEGEVNGLMTYDREIIKMDINKTNKVNSNVYKVLVE